MEITETNNKKEIMPSAGTVFMVRQVRLKSSFAQVAVECASGEMYA